MNKSQLYTLSGALLATTALAGVASAGTVGRFNGDVSTAGAFLTASASIANTLFSATAATANAINFNAATGAAQLNPLGISFTNQLPAGSAFNVTLNVAGAQFNNPGVGVAVMGRNAASFVGTVNTAACGAITPLVDKILISACALSNNVTTLSAAFGDTVAAGGVFAGGLQLSGIVFNTASGLATAGSSISLSGTVTDNANPSIVLESITSGNVVTSVAPIVTTVTAGVAAVTNPATTPTAFTSFTSPNAGQISVTLATVTITGTGALGTDLNTVISADGRGGQAASSSVTITVTSAALSDDAAVGASLMSPTVTITQTPAAFSTGTATFSILAASGYGSNSSEMINVQFDGTTAINAAASGTVAVAYGTSAGTGHPVAPAAGAGITSAIASGGFRAEFNTAQASGSEFQSFIRIHNNGGAAGPVVITVLNDATGMSMGTFTTGSIAVGQTMQVDMPTIEAGAGITMPAGQYTLQLTGPIVAYAQHVLFNATTGQFSDLSAFRNGQGTNNP